MCQPLRDRDRARATHGEASQLSEDFEIEDQALLSSPNLYVVCHNGKSHLMLYKRYVVLERYLGPQLFDNLAYNYLI